MVHVMQLFADATRWSSAIYAASYLTCSCFVALKIPGMCRGGLRFGSLAGTFCAVQQVSSIARAERGAADVLVAGTVTGAIFGATGTLCYGIEAYAHA